MKDKQNSFWKTMKCFKSKKNEKITKISNFNKYLIINNTSTIFKNFKY